MLKIIYVFIEVVFTFSELVEILFELTTPIPPLACKHQPTRNLPLIYLVIDVFTVTKLHKLTTTQQQQM